MSNTAPTDILYALLEEREYGISNAPTNSNNSQEIITITQEMIKAGFSKEEINMELKFLPKNSPNTTLETISNLIELENKASQTK